MRQLSSNLRFAFCVIALAVAAGAPARGQIGNLVERLGFPKESKLLIIHADDLAMAHSVDAASFAALEKGAISSASIMVPCPWLTEVADYMKSHPDADLGIHLTLTSEWATYRWWPLLPRDRVPSLFDPSTGYPFADEGTAGRRIRPEDAEREIRAQIERAISMGIRPTHVDSHQGSLYQTAELLGAYAKVAREFGLPFLTGDQPAENPAMRAVLKPTDPIIQVTYSADESVTPAGWQQYYADLLRKLKPGVSELIVHLGYDDAELQAITVNHPGWGSSWRQRDFDVMTSPEFRELLKQNQVTVIGWSALKKLLPARSQ